MKVSLLSKSWVFFILLLLSFTRSNPICFHENHGGKAFIKKATYTSHEKLIPKETINVGFGDTITWKLLNQLEYKEENHEAYGVVMMPVFSKNVLHYHKKKVIIKGYILPVDRKSYALSKNVYASCFFCGKAGPETIIGLNFPTHPGRIKMDTYATVTGTLVVNGTNVEDWMYSLQDVEIIYMKE